MSKEEAFEKWWREHNIGINDEDLAAADAWNAATTAERARCVAAVEAYRKEKEQAADESASRGAGLSSIGHSFEAKACDAILAAIRGDEGEEGGKR